MKTETYYIVKSDRVDQMQESIDILNKKMDSLTASYKTLPSNTGNKKPLSREALAHLLGVSVQTIDKWKNMGLIPFRRINRRVFFLEDKVIEAMKNNDKFLKKG